MLFPVVIVIVLFVAGNYAVGYLGDGLSGVIEAKMTEWIEGISWLEWVSGVAGFLVIFGIPLLVPYTKDLGRITQF